MTHMHMVIWTGKALLLSGWLACLWFLYKKGRFRYALAGVLWLAAVSVVFGILPSPVGYSLPCTACDMAAYVSIAQSMAAGNPLGESYFAGGVPEVLNFGYQIPVAAAHALTGLDVVDLYQYGGAAALCLALCLFTLFGYRPLPGDEAGHLWTGLFMGVFLFFLSDPPLSFAVAAHAYDFGDFWSVLVLSKPGHVLGYGLVPLIFRAYAGERPWRSAILAGLALGVAALSYLVVALFTGAVLAVYSLLSSRWEAGPARPEMRRLLLAFAVALAAAAPYWLPIASSLDVFGLARTYSTGGGGAAEGPDFFGPIMEIARDFDLVMFALAGICVLLYRRGKSDMLLLSCVATAFGLFAANKAMAHLAGIDLNPLFKFPHLFLRQTLAFPAGVGAYALIRLIASHRQNLAACGRRFLRSVPSVATVVLLALTPLMAPVRHYPLFSNWSALGAAPLSGGFLSLTDWIRSNTGGETTFLSEPDLGMYICTFTGRKAWLVPDEKMAGNFLVDGRERKEAVQRAFTDSASAGEALCRAGVDYVVWSDGMPDRLPMIGKKRLEKMPFERVHAAEGYKVFKITGCDRPGRKGGS